MPKAQTTGTNAYAQLRQQDLLLESRTPGQPGASNC